MPNDDPIEAEIAIPWAPGRPAVRNTRMWAPRGQPFAEVYMEGGWRPARVSMRQDRADGAVIYHLEVTLPPGDRGASHRAVIWDRRSLRVRPEAGQG